METMSELVAFVLILIMSLHAATKGMSVGAASKEKVLMSTFVRIAVHKGLKGFVVKTNIINNSRYIM